MRQETSFAFIDLPEAVEDRSVLQFVLPQPPSSDPMVDSDIRRCISLARMESPQGLDALAARLMQFSVAQLFEVAVESDQAWQHPRYGRAPAIDFTHEFRPAQRLRQAIVCLPGRLPNSATVVTFTASVQDFEAAMPEFRKAFESIEVR